MYLSTSMSAYSSSMPSSSGSLADLTLSSEKSLLVIASQESPTQEKDASVLVISSSESATKDEQDLLVISSSESATEDEQDLLVISSSESASQDQQDLLAKAAPTRVSSLDEGNRLELDRNGDSTSHQGDIEGKQVEKLVIIIH